MPRDEVVGRHRAHFVWSRARHDVESQTLLVHLERPRAEGTDGHACPLVLEPLRRDIGESQSRRLDRRRGLSYVDDELVAPSPGPHDPDVAESPPMAWRLPGCVAHASKLLPE